MRYLPLFWLISTTIALGFNLLGLMRLVPLFLSLPLLFACIYFTIFSFTHRRSFKGLR